MTEHKEVCLKINDKQTVKLRSGSLIKLKSHFKQLVVPFKINADFECILKKVKSSDKSSDRSGNASCTEKCQSHIPCSFSCKLVCIDDKSSKPIVLYRGKAAVYKFIEAILGEYDCCKKVKNKHYNKNLVMSAEDEERFQPSNKCWIFDKLFNARGDKVRDHCHVT